MNWAREPWQSSMSGGKGDNSAPHGTVCVQGGHLAHLAPPPQGGGGVRRSIGAATGESSAEFPQNTENGAAFQPSGPRFLG